MRIHLLVRGGTRDGHSLTLDTERVLVGRDPSAHLRFDADRDRQVSARHAELLYRDRAWHVRDLNSTNGTFRNGTRIGGDEPLMGGDRIAFGEDGPSILVNFPAPPDLPPANPGGLADGQPVSRKAPTASSGRSRSIAIAGALLLLAVMGIGLTAAGVMRGRDARQSDAGSEFANASTVGGPAAAMAPPPTASSGEMDYAAIVAANARAVALVAVEMPGGDASSGTAFAVGDQLLLTNRHVVQVGNGPRAERVLVKFSETDSWIPAHVDRVDPTWDLATLRLEEPATAPRYVRGIAAPGTGPKVGDPVALIGYPLGTDTPMESDDDDFVAAPSVFRGMVSKRLADVLQIDAFAGHGSSGSPVLDRRGAVVGVIYGGPREAGGRIAYAVPPEALLRFLTEAETARIQ